MCVKVNCNRLKTNMTQNSVSHLKCSEHNIQTGQVSSTHVLTPPKIPFTDWTFKAQYSPSLEQRYFSPKSLLSAFLALLIELMCLQCMGTRITYWSLFNG